MTLHAGPEHTSGTVIALDDNIQKNAANLYSLSCCTQCDLNRAVNESLKAADGVVHLLKHITIRLCFSRGENQERSRYVRNLLNMGIVVLHKFTLLSRLLSV